MKLAIIGSKTFKQSTVDALIKESKKKFTKVVFAPIDEVIIQTINNKIEVIYDKENLLLFDAIYPRFSSRDTLLGEAILKSIQTSNAYSPVNLESFQITNHKFSTTQILSSQKVPGITSTLFISPKCSEWAVNETNYPFVMKLISGFAGKGVVLVNNKEQMDSILDAIHLFEEFICTQKFIKGKNYDVRCYVVGDYVIAVKRTSKKGEWRANVSRGGSAELINPTPEMLKISKESAKVLGMDICAVDLMDNNNNWVVIEVNFMPGPFSKYLGTTIVQEWVRLLVNKVKEKNKNKQKSIPKKKTKKIKKKLTKNKKSK